VGKSYKRRKIDVLKHAAEEESNKIYFNTELFSLARVFLFIFFPAILMHPSFEIPRFLWLRLQAGLKWLRNEVINFSHMSFLLFLHSSLDKGGEKKVNAESFTRTKLFAGCSNVNGFEVNRL
jgi:hypothetical protein